MLAALDIRMYPNEDCELPHPSGHLMHAAVLRLAQKENPEMTRILHDDAQVKPFAVSTIWPKTRATGDKLILPKYTECRVRLCCANRPTFESLTKPLFQKLAVNGTIELRGNSFTLLEAIMEGPYGGVSTFRDLVSDQGSLLALRFVSPTTFRRKGLNVPLPDPQLVYGSLWQKWQALSDTPLQEETFEEMSSVLALSDARIGTRVWKYPNYMMNGFVGIAAYELVKPVSKKAREMFSALTELAFYTGVGYRTAMGMGQCRILKPETDEKE